MDSSGVGASDGFVKMAISLFVHSVKVGNFFIS